MDQVLHNIMTIRYFSLLCNPSSIQQLQANEELELKRKVKCCLITILRDDIRQTYFIFGCHSRMKETASVSKYTLAVVIPRAEQIMVSR